MTWSTTPLGGQHDDRARPATRRPAMACQRGRRTRARARTERGSTAWWRGASGTDEARHAVARLLARSDLRTRCPGRPLGQVVVEEAAPRLEAVVDAQHVCAARRRRRSSLSVSRMATRRPSRLGDEDDPEVHRARPASLSSLRRPTSSRLGRPVGLELLRATRAGAPRQSPSPGLTWPADADRPALVEPSIAAGPRAAHEEEPSRSRSTRYGMTCFQVRGPARPRRGAGSWPSAAMRARTGRTSP